MSRDHMRAAGVAGFGAAALTVVAVTLGDLVRTGFYFLAVPAMVLLVVALIGFQALKREGSGRVGRCGTYLLAGGLSVLAVMFAVIFTLEGLFEVDLEASEGALTTFAEIVIVVCFFALIIGLVLFAFASIRAGVLPRLATLLLLFGFPAGLVIDGVSGAFSDKSHQPFGWIVGAGAMAAGLSWMSYVLRTREQTAAGSSLEEASAPAASVD